LLGGNTIAPTALLENRKSEAVRLLQLYGTAADAHTLLWEQLDVAYFMRHSPAEIAWHTRMLMGRVSASVPIVRAHLSRVGEGTEVLVYVHDQKDLFARICGYFDSRGFSIMDARIHTTRHGFALDTFLINDHDRGGTHYRALHAQIETQLSTWLTQPTATMAPLGGRLSRQSRHFPVLPTVHLTPDDTGGRYLLNLTTTDRVGLLYSIAQVLARHALNVQTARILTLGERVEDVFLIEGTALNDAKQQLQLEQDLLTVLVP
jgi:[protein-PII] uridylyltransferase